MNRATCVLIFYLIGGTVAISFLIPDMLAQKNLDSGVLENAKVAIYLVDLIEILVCHMWLGGCSNPRKIEQCWECTFFNLYAHVKTK